MYAQSKKEQSKISENIVQKFEFCKKKCPFKFVRPHHSASDLTLNKKQSDMIFYWNGTLLQL